MIGYVTLGTNDMEKSFYGALLAEVGAKRAGPTFYAGYFRDLDGNKLTVFCVTAS